MEKNYYEILEIDKKASPEIIKKAYSTLAKKYHPDLQPANLKSDCEEKIKLINEAYETLSDEEKRKNYDLILENSENKNQEIIDNLINENNNLKNKLNNLDNLYKNTNADFQEQQNIYDNNYSNQILYQQELERARQKAYRDAYIQDLKNRGYKIKYKKTFKEKLISLASIVITVSILFLLWQLPFVRNFFSQIEGLNIIANFLNNLF